MNDRTERSTTQTRRHLRDEDLLIDDLYAGDEPLTPERRRELGWPETAEEALARMEAEARKREAGKDAR